MFLIGIEFIKPEEMSESDRKSIWQLYSPHHNDSQEEFESRRRGMDFIAIFRQRKIKKIVGFTGVRTWRTALPELGDVFTFYLGLTFIAPKYRGHNLIQRTVIRQVLGSWLLRPQERVFFWSDCISYKPYLLAVRNLREFYPSPNRETPQAIRKLIDSFGNQYYPGQYLPTKGTVIKKYNRLKVGVADIAPSDLLDPHIQFFAKANEGYTRGDGLIALFPATLSNLFYFLIKKTLRMISRKGARWGSAWRRARLNNTT